MKTPKPPERAAHNVHCRSDGRLISTGQHGGGGGDLCNVGRLPQEERLAGERRLPARQLSEAAQQQ